MNMQLKDISSQYIGQKITIEGIVTQIETQYPFLHKAAFQCLRCGHVTTVKQDSFKLQTPFAGCENDTCGKMGPFRLIQEDSTYLDAQDIIIWDYAVEEYREQEPNKILLPVILIGDAVGKAKLEEKYIFTGELVTSDLGKKLGYLLYADSVEIVPLRS
jgi:replicative DNA helicase Mcm